MKLAMLLVSLLSLATTAAGVCEDKDPEMCLREVGDVAQKIDKCDSEDYAAWAEQCPASCGYCPHLE